MSGPARRPARSAVLVTVLALLSLALATLLAGCAGADSATEDAGGGEEFVGAEAAPEAEAAQDGPVDGADQDAGADEAGGEAASDPDAEAAAADVDVALGASTATQAGRRVVTTTVEVAVDDVADAARRTRDLAVVAGGFVAGESTVGGEHPSAELVLRVPVQGVGDVTADVAALGEEVSRTTEDEDVENTLVDLESRVATQRAGVERVRALLAEATSLDDVLALERELTRRQADLESLDARRAALADRAALATLTVRLGLPDDVRAAEVEEVPPFLAGLTGGWEALVASTGVVLLVVGGLLPWVVALAVLGGLVWLAVRVVRRAATTSRPAARSAGPGAPEAPSQV
ncbi:DUF4349 domain-containing protein [Aquipuribacter nitratireducens]|uniref:DUF4349 domain-containing protein n=1 Tax=Aquipuribacter nitratireducens TaxID=650104 RepID=A0ABW0GQF0_9MICO